MPRMLADAFDDPNLTTLLVVLAGAGVESAGVVANSAAGVANGTAPADDDAAGWGTAAATSGAEEEAVAAMANGNTGTDVLALLGKDTPPKTGRLGTAAEADDGGKAEGTANGLDEKGVAEDDTPKAGTKPPAANPKDGDGPEPKPKPEPEPPNCELLPKPPPAPNTEE